MVIGLMKTISVRDYLEGIQTMMNWSVEEILKLNVKEDEALPRLSSEDESSEKEEGENEEREEIEKEESEYEL